MAKPPTLSDVIAARVRKYRQERGWSVRELADRCAKTGASTLTQASLTNIERGLSTSSGRGSRAVTATELFSLAFVMEVPPVMLMLPLGEHTQFEICPGITIEPFLALQWMVGGDPMRLARTATFDRTALPPSYTQAGDQLSIYAAVENARDAAQQILKVIRGDSVPLVQLRRQVETRWQENPSQRPYLEYLADRNNRPRPGQDISDEEFVAQWRALLPKTYKERLRAYADAMWRAVDAGFEVLPPVPRDLYVDIMSSFPKSGGIPLDGGDVDDIDPLTGEPRERPTQRRPVLPPNIEVQDGGPDGDS